VKSSDSPAAPQKPDVILCADWSKSRAKRSVYIARVAERSVKKVTGTKWSFGEVMKLATKEREHGKVLVAFDVPLGVPASYFKEAKAGESFKAARTFVEWLPLATEIPDFFVPVSIASEWSVTRPYFKVPSGKGAYGKFDEAAKALNVILRRQIDILTSAKSGFAIGIPGNVAPAAQSLWSELVVALKNRERFHLWPFDGDLGDLLDTGKIVAGEIYPRAAYATALADKLPARIRALKKAKCSVRRQAIESLLAASWVRTSGVSLNDYESALDSEDDFDALITSAAMLRCAIEDLPFGMQKFEDPIAEGGILGTGTLTFSDGN